MQKLRNTDSFDIPVYKAGRVEIFKALSCPVQLLPNFQHGKIREDQGNVPALVC